MGDLLGWLERLGLERYHDVLVREQVTIDSIPLLSDQDLKGLGIPLGHRVKLLSAAKEIRQGKTQSATASAGDLTDTDTMRRPLTVMFCDLVDSIALAQQYGQEEYRDILNAYRQACSTAIERYGGYIARYVGDGILAYFGYPRAHEDDAGRAVHAALEVLAAVNELDAQQGQQGAGKLAVRIALASGDVIVGDLISGSSSEKAAATGDAPNLAARLQAIAGPDTIILDQTSRDRAGKQFDYQDLGTHHLKGFAEPIRAWRAIGERFATRFEARMRDQASLVGREVALESLSRLWQHTLAKNGRVGIISGRAGIGKSRLIDELRQRVFRLATGANEPRPIAIGLQCSPYHIDTPLHPVTRMIERLAEFARSDSTHSRLSKLKRLLERMHFDGGDTGLALLSDLLSLDSGPDVQMNAREKRLRQLELLLALLKALAAPQPVLLAFEDVQWIDPTSRELLQQLIGAARGVAILVLVTLRTEPEYARGDTASLAVPSWLLDAGAELHAVEELSHGEARRMMLNLAGGRDVPSDVAEIILRKGEGIPLFIEELTRSWIYLREGGKSVRRPPLPEQMMAVPDSLSSALMARIDHLGSAKNVTLQASVIGREFSVALLSKISDLDATLMRLSLERLCDADILQPVGGASEPTYSFKHALIRDEAYASILKGRRSQIHRHVAQELENELAVRPQIPLNLIAEHYAKDSAPGRAIKLWRQAAARSMARSAHHEAASMLERALELLPELDESPPRTELELELTAESAVALRSIRGYAAPEVEERYLRARALSGEVDAPHIEFNVDWGLFQCNLVKGDLARAGEYAERLRVSAEALPDRFRVDANLAIGMVKLHQGAFERAREALERSLILTDPLRDDPHLLTHGQNPGIFCRSNLAHTLAFIGHAAEARNLAQENLSIARSRQSEPSHIYTYVNALAFASRVYVVLREPAAVYRISDELVQIARNNRYSYYEAIGHAQIGWVRASEAKDRTQIEGFAEKIGTLEATGTELAVRGFYAQLAELYAELGDKDAACSALERTTGGSGTRTWDVELERVRGLIAALEPMSDPELAEAAFKSSLDCARAQRSGTQELRTSVSYSLFLVRHERIEEARQLIDACLSRLSECRDIADAAKARQVLQQIGLQAGD